MIDIVKLANGNVGIYDSISGDFINSLSPDVVEIECNVNGSVKVIQDNANVEYFDPAMVANTQVVPAAAIPFTGTCADLAALLSSDFFFVVSGGGGTVTSVGLTMPTAFTVANSPITSAGTINVTGAGLISQYVRGDGTLANFPTNVGGGSSVSYYLNGSINQGTFGGNIYHQLSKTAILGGGTNFTINANGYIAQFLTNAGDPALLNIPAGNWDFQLYFSASSVGGSPQFYTELYKYDGTTFTLIASGSTSPQNITGGTFADVYVSNLAVPSTTLTLTDRLAIRVYVIHSGRTITLYTEDNKLAEVHTTFSTGIAALNGLTAQIQSFSTGTTGTDFNISSSSSTHTFNLPTASALNRGLLSTTDWSTFNGKQNSLGFTPVTDARTITINGTAQNLTADRSWNTYAIVPVQSVVSAATVTPTSTNQLVIITAQSAGLTLANPTGAFVEGQPLMIRIKDNGTARAINYDTNYRAIGVTLPTTTVINKTTYLGIIYNAVDGKWDVIGVTTQA